MGVLSPMEYKQSLGQRYSTGFRTNERAHMERHEHYARTDQRDLHRYAGTA
jgi:hypothetical protein